VTEAAEVSPWGEIVGPCYTAHSLARALGWAESEVAEAATALTVLEVVTNDGVALYPSFQVHEGRLVGGLGAALQVLSTGARSRWTRANRRPLPWHRARRRRAQTITRCQGRARSLAAVRHGEDQLRLEASYALA